MRPRIAISLSFFSLSTLPLNLFPKKTPHHRQENVTGRVELVPVALGGELRLVASQRLQGCVGAVGEGEVAVGRRRGGWMMGLHSWGSLRRRLCLPLQYSVGRHALTNPWNKKWNRQEERRCEKGRARRKETSALALPVVSLPVVFLPSAVPPCVRRCGDGCVSEQSSDGCLIDYKKKAKGAKRDLTTNNNFFFVCTRSKRIGGRRGSQGSREHD